MISPRKRGVPFGEVVPPAQQMSNGRSNKPGSGSARTEAGEIRSYYRRCSRTNPVDEGIDLQYNAVLQALAGPSHGSTAKGNANKPSSTAERKPRRGIPLVQWVWPSNTSASAISSVESSGMPVERFSQENPMPLQARLLQPSRINLGGRTPTSSVVTGKVCEPIRPTRLDLSSSEGHPTSSRVIYTAKGGHTNPNDAPIVNNSGPLSLNLPLPSPHEAPWLDSAAGGGGGRGRTYSANSASAAGLPSPRYLQSTTVSQAKAVEPGEAARVAGKVRAERTSRGRRVSLDGGSATMRNGLESESWGGGGAWGAAGMLESLGGFLGIGKGAGDAGKGKEAKRGKAKKQSKGAVEPGASRTTTAGAKIGSKVLRRLRKSPEGDGKHARYGSVKVKVPRAGNRGPSADQILPAARVTRRDEREVLTMHTDGVLKPEGVKLRVVKASGRTLEDTKFHMEIRTLRPGQVWSVCRRHPDFHKLHACLQGRFPALALPRLPRSPPGGVPLEPATLERTRAGLQSYIGSLVADVPAAWGVEEFIMFLDSDEKGRRLFARKRKETRRVSVRSPVPEEQESTPTRPRPEDDSDLSSSRESKPDPLQQKSLLDRKVEEKKLAMASLEGAAQNHFDGVGAVMNTAVSFSDDDDLGFDEGADFIDGEEAIRAMLDRDAEEAEDDNLFSIPAGTDFGAPLDDDDDIGEDFDINYHG